MKRHNSPRNDAQLSAIGVFLATTTWLTTASAVAQNVPQPPLISAVDERGVNLGNGEFALPDLSVGIGGIGSGLERVMTGPARYYNQSSFQGDIGLPYLPSTGIQSDNHSNSIVIMPGSGASSSGGPVIALVSYSGITYQFYVGYWSNYRQNQSFYSNVYLDYAQGATLNCSDYNMRYTVGTCNLVLADGSSVVYDRSFALQDPSSGSMDFVKYAAFSTSATKPDGELIQFYYYSNSGNYGPTLKTVKSNLGWMLSYKYESGRVSQVSTFNASTLYCDPNAISCNSSVAFPYAASEKNGNRTKIYTNGILKTSYSITGTAPGPYEYAIESPSGGLINVINSPIDSPATAGGIAYYSWFISVEVGHSAGVSGPTWLYNFRRDNLSSLTGNPYFKFHTTIRNPNSTVRSVEVSKFNRIIRLSDEISRVTSYLYGTEYYGQSSSMSLGRFVPPEGTSSGGYTEYTYDTCNRVKTIISKSKVGSGLPDQVTTVEYMETAVPCVNPKTCNKPLWIDDAKGNRTDFTYYTHGGVETVTRPADANGIRPQTRSYYTQLYPKVRDAGNNLVNSTPVWRLTRTETCASSTNSCSGAANEAVTLYEYNQNNLLLTAVITKAGDANIGQAYSAVNVWQKTEYGYDDIGNQVWVDGPRTDVDDRSYTTYDVLRRKVFEISGDPDGGAGLLRVVIKHSYDVDGREWLIETGTGSNIAFTNGVPTNVSDFLATSFHRNTYDVSTGLLIKTEVGKP